MEDPAAIKLSNCKKIEMVDSNVNISTMPQMLIWMKLMVLILVARIMLSITILITLFVVIGMIVPIVVNLKYRKLKPCFLMVPLETLQGAEQGADSRTRAHGVRCSTQLFFLPICISHWHTKAPVQQYAITQSLPQHPSHSQTISHSQSAYHFHSGAPPPALWHFRQAPMICL